MTSAEWLLGDTDPADVLIPEALGPDQQMIARTAADFLKQEVEPSLDALDRKDWSRARALLKRCGDLGLLGADVPEEFGGSGLDKTTAVVIGEALGSEASFAVAFGAQTSLAIVPLLWFGTNQQKQEYLPRLVSGEIAGAYALSESGSGSDALSARTRATKAADGSWRLSGEKMWISNGGFADLFVVFAKIDGEEFSAFLVERGFAGVSTGREEHKMGLHGSSTAPLILQDAAVPATHLLGAPGKGHKIAFNVLNVGRFKLAAMCSGCAKTAIREAAQYASTRRQFDRPIATFGAIRQKLAEMAVREYAVESMLYRTAGMIDNAIAGSGVEAASVDAFEEFAIEASLLKVAGSEMLDFVLDENVQIHGGNGFVRDYPAERRYRDARVNRIFEGTNEINRLLAPGMLIKRAVNGRLALIAAARRLQDEVLAPGRALASGDDLAAATRQNVVAIKKTTLMILGLAMQTYGAALQDEQELLMIAADLARDAYAAESGMLRAQRRETAGDAALHLDAAAVLAHDACLRADAAARTALAAIVSGDALATSMAALRRLMKIAPVNAVAARRRIAHAVLTKGRYPFEPSHGSVSGDASRAG
jgi:alkylation response protein AidB-like acyl-CoA dehydrogenase